MQSMYCRCCYYDLQRLDQDVCPECGEAFDRGNPKTYLTSIPPCGMRLYGLVFAVTLVAAAFAVWVGDVGFLLAIPLVAAAAGTLCAMNFTRRELPPVHGGVWGGFVATCMLILMLHIHYVVKQAFFYQGPYPEPFFEDGFVTEVFLYPIGGLAVFGPIGMAIGLIAGLITSAKK